MRESQVKWGQEQRDAATCHRAPGTTQNRRGEEDTPPGALGGSTTY
jgi:hypothetical protein